MTDLETVRAMFAKIGAALTVLSCVLTFIFGISQASNWLLALILASGLAAASYASAYVWPFVARAMLDRKWAAGVPLAIFGLLVTGTDFTTNFGSIAWQRTTNVQRATVQNARYDDVRDSVASKAETRAMLIDMRKQMTSEAPWVATVKASGLRGELDAANEAVVQESRRGGCGPICLGLKRKAAEIEARIATAEKAEDIDKRLAALDRALDDTKAKAEVTEKSESAAAMQNASLASVFTLSLDPSEAAQHWTDKGVAWMVAAFFTFGAMGCNFIGLRGGRDQPAPRLDSKPVTYASQEPDNLLRAGQPPDSKSAPAPGGSSKPSGYLADAIALAKDAAKLRPTAVYSSATA